MPNEKIIIVDEKDEIIGYKERGEILRDDMYRATGLWIENSKGDILMAQRSFSKKNAPGKWGPAVSGTVEEGETYDSNVVKEAEEEIGLSGYAFKKEEKIRVRGEHNYFAQWYSLVIDKDISEFRIEKKELEGLKWFDSQELARELEKNPDDFVEALKQNSDLFHNK